MRVKRILSTLMCTALVLTLLPSAARAAQGSDFTVIGDAAGYTYGASGVLTFTQDGSYTVEMAGGVTQTTTDRIVVNSGVTANITLSGVDIDVSAADACAFDLYDFTHVNVTLSGTNSLKSGDDYAGLHVPERGTITIDGSGAVTATGGSNLGGGAGIGGNYGEIGGGIRIMSGTVTALGGDGAAGIGGGKTAGGGQTTVDGGTIEAQGSTGGAGIGGGALGNSGTIVINNGTVIATGGQSGAGIGGGAYRPGGTVTINAGMVTAASTDGAGIGGGFESDGGAVNISGGIINATSVGGAGIGGGTSGSGGNGGTVTISGGTINATGSYGAGIGGGVSGNGGTVCISGGSVNAKSTEGEAIGHGRSGSTSGTLTNKPAADGGVNVYLTTVTLSDAAGTGLNGASITSLVSSLGYSYGVTGMKTDANGKLYLYLPEGDVDLELSDAANGYAASPTVNTSGTAAVTANDLSSTSVKLTRPWTYNLTQSNSAATENTIMVSGGAVAAPVNITLKDVNIDQSIAGGCAFELQGTSVVSLTLSGNNNLTSGTNNAGLQVPENAILSITGGSTDTLTATGALLGAGIGTKDNGGNCGAVTINGGTIIASSGGGAGIGSGGGHSGDGGTVTITGGVVRASSFNGAGIGCGDNGPIAGNGGLVTISSGTLETSSVHGAGIGGSVNGNGATVTITGGSVHATSTNGMAIGCGSSGADSGTLTNGSGADVYLTTVTLDGVSAVTAVSALTTGLEYTYGTNDMYTDASGKLYLYLPDDSVTYGAQTAAQGYSGNVETKTDPTSSLGTLSADSVVPTVSAVTPTGTGAALSGSIVITFSEPMSTTAGAVSLDGGTTTLAAGSWTADKTVYTAPYSGLSYSTACTVAISGFKDAAGNVMTADTGHSFTTGTAPVGGGGGTSGSNTQNQPVISVDRGTATVTVKAVLNGDGTLDASLTGADIADALQKAAASAGESGTVVLELVIDGPASAFGMTLKLPSSALGSMTGGALDLLTLKTPMGTFSFDAETLAQIARQANGDLEIAVSAVDPSTLSEDARELVGTRPVYDFSITSGSTVISDFGGGTVTVSLPYTPADGEDPDNIVVYYISDSGEPVAVPNCIYDAKTGTVTFTTTHFSVYAVGYNDVSFSDVSGWYEECVDFVAARGIMNGVGADWFDPDGTMTRAMFVTILHRLSGETGSYTNVFGDVPAGAYYENAAAWAAETGIAGGVGNDLFNPNAEITREQLAVMLYRYAQHMGYDVSVGEDTNILSYSDALTISDYAYSALQWACGAGIMDGDEGGNLNPHSSAARAQAAAMLQRFILNTIS